MEEVPGSIPGQALFELQIKFLLFRRERLYSDLNMREAIGAELE